MLIFAHWRGAPIGKSKYALLLLGLTLSTALKAGPAVFLTPDDFVSDWRISKQFTIAVAEKMPAELYDFKATPEERSFGEQMAHVAGSLFDRFNEISGIAPVKRAVPRVITKEFVIEWLNQSFDYVIQVLPKLTDEELSKARFKVDFEGRPSPEINGRDMIMNIFVHVAHHRAQCEVYLRLKGITPPVYTF
jgi:uncharacterized damage-inducible protein DinB